MTDKAAKKGRNGVRTGDVPFSTSLPEAVGAAFAAWQSEHGMTKRDALLVALRSLGLVIEDKDIGDRRRSSAADLPGKRFRVARDQLGRWSGRQ